MRIQTHQRDAMRAHATTTTSPPRLSDMSMESGKRRHMPFRPDRPYNALAPLPPPVDVETHAILKACIEARAALAEINVAGELIPNQTVLINSIRLLEAQASSEIETIVTTTDRLFRFAKVAEDKAGPATKEALRYRTALYEGFMLLARRPLSTATAVQICRTRQRSRAGAWTGSPRRTRNSPRPRR